MAAKHEMALSFGAGAGDYDRLRPRYPDAAVDWAIGSAAVRTVLDLGAGTGLLTMALAGRGLAVTAVEPDEAMRDVLARRLPGVTATGGVAEEIPLGAAAVDAVFVGQAFHWFSRPAADLEIGRVLRPGGVVAVLTNVNPVDADYEGILHHRVLGVAQPALTGAVAPLAPEVFTGETATLIDNPQQLTREQFLALPSTWSWVATAAPAERERVAIEAARLAEEIESAGVVSMPYSTRVVRALRR